MDALAGSLQDVELKAESAPQTQEALFKVQDAPKLPVAPLPESITTKVGYPLAGAILGAFISAAYVYILYRMDQTIRTTSDLSGLGVPLLGYVPEIRKGPGAGLWRYTPFAWLMRARARHYARRVAASIANLPAHQGGA